MDQPTAQEALKRLEPLVGEWTLEAKPPDGPPWPGEARATIEWHDSGAHLVAALDGGDARGTRRHLDHGMRRRQRDLLPALLRRARRLPRLRDEHRRRGGGSSGARANRSRSASARRSAMTATRSLAAGRRRRTGARGRPTSTSPTARSGRRVSRSDAIDGQGGGTPTVPSQYRSPSAPLLRRVARTVRAVLTGDNNTVRGEL